MPKETPATKFKYKPQYGVIVLCKDEAEQRRRFESLKKRNWKLRVVCV